MDLQNRIADIDLYSELKHRSPNHANTSFDSYELTNDVAGALIITCSACNNALFRAGMQAQTTGAAQGALIPPPVHLKHRVPQTS